MAVVANRKVAAIRGGGDLGSACAVRLHRCGFQVVIAEQAAPTAVRRTVSFSDAVFNGRAWVEELAGVLKLDPIAVDEVWRANEVPVLIDPNMRHILDLRPDIIVDALMVKQNRGMRHDMAPGTIGLGPGFIAGRDVDAVVETNRGPDLGRVIWHGTAEADSHVPAAVEGHSVDRVLRAPREGVLEAQVEIGAIVARGQVIGEVEGNHVLAPFDGVVRGLLRSGSKTKAGMKIGDVDPRMDPGLCHRVSDKALAVAGGVVEASFMLLLRSPSGQGAVP
jgi:xanthine dehydrogenase accessory factor